MKINYLIIVNFLLLSFNSCKTIEGEGGTSTIYGKVFVYDLNSVGDTIDQYYAADEDVYIIYGDSSKTYDDKFSTSFDGSYKFKYLQKGKYQIFVYTKCDTCDGEIGVVSKSIEILENYTQYNIEDIIIYK